MVYFKIKHPALIKDFWLNGLKLNGSTLLGLIGVLIFFTKTISHRKIKRAKILKNLRSFYFTIYEKKSSII
jgi:prolipoprotein diacylglyceryltransferase